MLGILAPDRAYVRREDTLRMARPYGHRLGEDVASRAPARHCLGGARRLRDRLAKESGGSYFRQLGLDAKGTFIEDADGPIIASVAANSEGRNLQGKWCDNLLTACPADAEKLEQVIGRNAPTRAEGRYGKRRRHDRLP